MNDYNILYLLLLAPLLLFLRPDVEELPPVWEYESNAITITYHADQKLNMFNGRPHTLVLVIYQLTDGGPFQDIAKQRNGVRTLLDQTRFDPCVTAIDNVTVQPGESQKAVLPRVEGTRWVGLVAGYYSMEPGAVDRLIQIPTNRVKSGWFRRKEMIQPAVLALDVELGPERIEKADTHHGTY